MSLITKIEEIARIGYSPIYRAGPRGLINPSVEKAIFFKAGMTIDADGCATAYHPKGCPPGLDKLGNAGHPGNWWGLAKDPKGVPYVQKEPDPHPGFYFSTTALEHPDYPENDTRRYVPSDVFPFIVLPGKKTFLREHKIKLGDLCMVANLQNGLPAPGQEITQSKAYPAIFADIGPPDHLGEASMALARALGINESPTKGGTNHGILYIVFPGTRIPPPTSPNTWTSPDYLDQIYSASNALFEKWGGWWSIANMEGLIS
jgi:hypothetical protein